MEKIEAKPSMRSLIIVVVIAAAFSSFTLWLLESWIKYPLDSRNSVRVSYNNC